MKLPLHQCAACGGFFKRILFCCRIRRQADAGKHQCLNTPEQRTGGKNDQQKKNDQLPRQAVEFSFFHNYSLLIIVSQSYTQFPIQLSDSAAPSG